MSRRADGVQLSKWQVSHMWNDEDLRLAVKMAGNEPIQAIAKAVRKTKRATAQKLARQGFSWKHPDNEEL